MSFRLADQTTVLAIEFGLESDDANADPESRNLRPNWNFRILCVIHTHTEVGVDVFSREYADSGD